jgi:ribonuclease P protein component
MAFQFTSAERLKSRIAFGKLFKNGKSVKHFPIRLVYVEWPSNSPTQVQVAFSVPKKRFKNAVDRNRIKRQMREAYRLNRAHFLTEPKHQWALLFIYLPAEKLEYSKIEHAIVKCMSLFAEKQSIL